MKAIDLFAGPGGWDEGALTLGVRPLGVELVPIVCATRRSAGHHTYEADVAALTPHPHELDPELLIGSPPCTAYSQAGGREGLADQALVYTCARSLAAGADTRAATQAACGHPASLLVVEPLRWVLALRPPRVALEQVEPVLPLWRLIAHLLGEHGYATWAGVLNAADYGVPQVRKRAFLLASLDGQPHPPPPTHTAHPATTLWDEELLPWVTMAAALGWGEGDLIGFPRLSDGEAEVRLGGKAYRERDLRPASSPAQAVTEKGRSWQRWVEIRRSGERIHEGFDPDSAPAQTIVSRTDRWQVWVHERPATTVQGDPRVWAPGHKQNAADPPGKYQQRRGDQAIRITHEEGAVLQGFRRDYPWQGTSTERWQQIGNAVPPPLAAAVLGAVLK